MPSVTTAESAQTVVPHSRNVHICIWLMHTFATLRYISLQRRHSRLKIPMITPVHNTGLETKNQKPKSIRSDITFILPLPELVTQHATLEVESRPLLRPNKGSGPRSVLPGTLCCRNERLDSLNDTHFCSTSTYHSSISFSTTWSGIH